MEAAKPAWLQWLFWGIPFALPGRAFRDVAHRGFGFWDHTVFVGVVALFTWIVHVFLFFAFLTWKEKRADSK